MQLTQLTILILSVLDIAILILLPLLDARLYGKHRSGTLYSGLHKQDRKPFENFTHNQHTADLSVLDSRVTIKVYAVEILESVIFRLQGATGHKIGYDTFMLLPYKAKAMDYREVRVREILNEQFKETPFSYRFMNRNLVIVMENNELTPEK